MKFNDYERIMVLTEHGGPMMLLYWSVDENTVRFRYLSHIGYGENNRISDCNTIEQVYEHYNPRFLCLK